MNKGIIIYMFLFNTFILSAQDITVDSWLDTNRIEIGDQINYNIQINHPSELSVNYPISTDTLLSGIEILRKLGPDTVEMDDGSVSIGLKYLITSWDTGFYEIDPVFVESKTSAGINRAYSDYSLLEVIRTDIAPQDSTDVIFDIAGPRKAGITFLEILPWLLLLVVLGVVILILVKYVRKRSMVEVEEKTFLPGEPFHIIALRDLDKLEKKELWQNSRHKLYYSLLTEILRTYIDRRFRISCLEMTTDETLVALKSSGFDNESLYNTLKEILITADLSKFAKYRPSEKENTESISKSRDFIKGTIIKSSNDDNANQIDNVIKEESDD